MMCAKKTVSEIGSIDVNKLQGLMNSKGLSPSGLARRAGLSPAIISMILQKKRKGTPATVNKLSQALHVHPFQLLVSGNHDTILPNVDLAEAKIFTARIPVISWKDAIKWKESMPMSNDSVSVDAKNRFCYALPVLGDSMEPDFIEGSIIVVDPNQQPKSGDAVIAATKNSEEAFFKKYVVDAGKELLLARNPKYPTLEMDKDIEVIGVVIEQRMRF